MSIRNKQTGFTIVEILIVLAVAGVIMLVIFMAVPALKRNQTNTQRRADATHLASLINEYSANHAGSLPTALCTTLPCNAGAVDISAEKWSIMNGQAIVNTNAFPADTTTMNVNKGFTCDSTTNALSAGSTRSFSISYLIDTSGGTDKSCISG